MPKATVIKPTHKALRTYYQTLQTYRDERVENEGATETAFQQRLADMGATSEVRDLKSPRFLDRGLEWIYLLGKLHTKGRSSFATTDEFRSLRTDH